MAALSTKTKGPAVVGRGGAQSHSCSRRRLYVAEGQTAAVGARLTSGHRILAAFGARWNGTCGVGGRWPAQNRMSSSGRSTRPAALALSDFTDTSALGITIAGVALPHDYEEKTEVALCYAVARYPLPLGDSVP
jgi:hypothetical protein